MANIAIVGATGAVGEAIIEQFDKSDLVIDSLFLLASERTAGTSTMFRKKPNRVEKLEIFDFSQAHIVIFVANDLVAKEYIPKALDAGCYVLDNSRVYVQDDKVPLIISSVNGGLLDSHKYKHIANPDSAVIILWSVLSTIVDSVGIESLNVTSFQAVSGHGRRAISQLASETASLLNMKGVELDVFAKQIAFNVLPAVGDIDDEGLCLWERHLFEQSSKLMGAAAPKVNATTVQVPVFYGDSLSVNLHTEESIDAIELGKVLKRNKGLKVLPNQGDKALATPVTESTGSDLIYVSRIRNDMTHGRGINLWITADNVRVGAATNTVALARRLLKTYL